MDHVIDRRFIGSERQNVRLERGRWCRIRDLSSPLSRPPFARASPDSEQKRIPKRDDKEGIDPRNIITNECRADNE
jgi:hypothetical protein